MMEQEIVEVVAAVVFGAGSVYAAVKKQVAVALVSGGLFLLALAEAVAGK